ncbi:hypothetical protein SAMN05192552_1001273 [Natrinema hispanicum]|uniref:Uncharacterized protein n=1 Tax=Natrinema hispanicum TaxID=392421 RepID=A0A1G6IIM5_9EURY|nr:hypothetical protein SAMN05192552_1001273 [Natrinema hispanicum]
MPDMNMMFSLKLAMFIKESLNTDIVFRECDPDRVLIQLA